MSKPKDSAAIEREACARLVEEAAVGWQQTRPFVPLLTKDVLVLLVERGLLDLAKAIRARGCK